MCYYTHTCTLVLKTNRIMSKSTKPLKQTANEMSLVKLTEAIPNSVVTSTRAVLLSCLKGVPIRKFCSDYKRLVGEQFPWKRLGYQSFQEMLKAMSDTVRFEFSVKDGDYRLHGITTGNMFSPSWVSKTQDNFKSSDRSVNWSNGHKNTCQTLKSSAETLIDSTDNEQELLYNANGLATLFVSWNDIKHTQCTSGQEMKAVLATLMSTVATPVEVVVTSNNNYGFVRFSLLEEARDVWKGLNGTVHKGLVFKILPAKEKMPRKVKIVKTDTPDKKTDGPPTFKHRTSSAPCSLRGTHQGSSSDHWQRDKQPSSERKPLKNVRSLETNNSISSDPATVNSGSFNHQPTQRFHHMKSVQFSTSESDDSDCEWDFDLIDNPESKTVHVNVSMESIIHSAPVKNGTLPDGVSYMSKETSSVKDGCRRNGSSPKHLSSIQRRNDAGLYPVRISEVISPCEIWVQMTEHPEQDLETISQMIISDERIPLLVTDVKPGLCFSVLFDGCQSASSMITKESGESVCNQTYRRGLVMSVIQHIDQVQATLLLIDTGTRLSSVCLNQLYTLSPSLQLTSLPPLSIPTAIHGLICTFGKEDEWFPLDKQLIWKHLRHTMVYARVVEKPYIHKPGRMDLYFDPAGKERVIDLIVKEGIFLGICEANQNSRDVMPASPLPLTQAGIKKNSANHNNSVSCHPRSYEECCLESRLALIQESLERKELLKYEDKYKDTSLCLSDVHPALVDSTDFLCPTLSDVCQADDFDYYKEGPVVSCLSYEDVKGSVMNMPHLEDYQLKYSDSEEIFSDQSLSSTSAMSQQSDVDTYLASLPNKDLFADNGFQGNWSGNLTERGNWNGNLTKRTVDIETGGQSKPHSGMSSVSTNGCHENKNSPWGRMRMANGLT